MNKVTGIKSVDFKVIAKGHGVVNWNGSASLMGANGKTVDNHSMPKLRGYSNLTGKVKEETGYKYKKEVTDFNPKETPLYISQNCVRHHLINEQTFDIHHANEKNAFELLKSVTGLIKGYVIPSCQYKRTSPLLLEDFVDQLGNGNFEQFTQSGPRNSSSIYSKVTYGDTEYISYGSISIEQLQFIPLDNKYDRAAMAISEGEGDDIASELTEFIKTLDESGEKSPKVTFNTNYVRTGSIFNEGEVGILLNNDSIQVLVDYTLNSISELFIRQAKGWMCVDSVLVDYNDGKPMRIKEDESEITETLSSEYAVYYEGKE